MTFDEMAELLELKRKREKFEGLPELFTVRDLARLTELELMAERLRAAAEQPAAELGEQQRRETRTRAERGRRAIETVMGVFDLGLELLGGLFFRRR